MAHPWGQYHKLRPDQIETIRDEVSLAIIPWGALEWHSYHNPVGLDGMIAEHLAVALAQEAGGLVLPPVYVGTDTIKVGLGFSHTVEHDEETVRTLCYQFCSQLHAEGFRAVVVLTGHCGAGHRRALEEAVAKASAEFEGTRFRFIASFDPIQDSWAVNHAAVGETSLQMAVDSTNVDLSRLPKGRVADLEQDGVWGDDPSSATAESGLEITKLFVKACAPIVEDLLNDTTDS